MAITVVSGTPISGGDSSLAPGEAERGHHKRQGGGQRSMLHTTPAPQQSMPARTGGSQGGQAILASSQHTSWHHQASEYQEISSRKKLYITLLSLLHISFAMFLLSYLTRLMANDQSES